jgi:hypothetical protein
LNRLLAFFLALLLAAAGVLLYRHFFPPHEQRIRQTLKQAAATVSFGADTGNLARLAAINRLTSFFTPDIEILVEMPGSISRRVVGRDEVREVTAGTRAAVRALEVRLRDIAVELDEDRLSARAHVVVDVRIDGDPSPWISEFKLTMAHFEGEWLIRKIEPVRTLQM